MTKVALTMLAIASLILLCCDSDSERGFYATKIIGIAIGLGSVGFWALWFRGGWKV